MGAQYLQEMVERRVDEIIKILISDADANIGSQQGGQRLVALIVCGHGRSEVAAGPSGRAKVANYQPDHRGGVDPSTLR